MSDSVHEPPYTRGYSNETVCNYFYYLSIVILVLGVLGVCIQLIAVFSASPKNRMIPIIGLVATLIQAGLGYYMYLFSYIVCSRSLLDKKQ